MRSRRNRGRTGARTRRHNKTRHHRDKKILTEGSRAQVWHGTAKRTKGGLTKKDLVMNKHGHIVSRRRQAIAKREQRLKKAGYIPKKGEFKLMRKHR